jgi:predicted CoA-substrate-specific enzyme activase
MICTGIDAGSRAIKVVLYDDASDAVLAAGIVDQGVDQDQRADALFHRLAADTGAVRSDVARIVATGYGRNIVTIADTTITEITCHTVGVRHDVPDAATIIDIGGQDSKVMRLDARGAVRDFAMNDRCAAGTGRFLEIVAARLDTKLDALGQLARQGADPAAISSMCVVFAETEIIGLLASGRPRAEIVAGVQAAIASRVAAMVGRNPAPPIVFTGGVALVPGMLDALQNALQQPVSVAPRPQYTGALGAAILAARDAPTT